MQHIADIALTGSSSPGIQFRCEHYDANSIREFLRDVIAIANASVEGPRYIFTGCVDADGRRKVVGIDAETGSQSIDWRGLIGEYVEPPVRLRFDTIDVDGQWVGAFQIGDCQDRPYMMRIDHSESLRRGDAFMRVNDVAVKLGRRQLQALIEERFQESLATASVEIGFAGDIVHKVLALPTSDLAQLPSRVASAKLRELQAAQRGGHGATTRLVRLTHARLFGAERPYEDRTADQLDHEVRAIGEQYRDADARFLFSDAAHPVQLVVANQGEETLKDVSLKISLPRHEAIHVIEQPPTASIDDPLGFMADEVDTKYPAVRSGERAVHVTSTIGDIASGALTPVFGEPLRVCAEHALQGRRIGLDYLLFARNLREPVRGRLRIHFGRNPAEISRSVMA